MGTAGCKTSTVGATLGFRFAVAVCLWLFHVPPLDHSDQFAQAHAEYRSDSPYGKFDPPPKNEKPVT